MNLIFYLILYFNLLIKKIAFSKNFNETLNSTEHLGSSIDDPELYIDLFRSSCIDLCSNQNDYRPRSCKCDRCDIFDDCCQDMQKQILEKMYECEIKVGYNQWIYSISKCPKNYSDVNIRYNCESNEKVKILNLLPVYSEKTDLTYKNLYCAHCNIENIKYNEILPFEIDMSKLYWLLENSTELELLKDETRLENLITNYQDNIKFDLMGKVLRYCEKNLIENCPDNSTELEKAKCGNNTAKRNVLGKNYKNENCLLCHGMDITSGYCPFSPRSFVFGRKSLQILFEISDLNLFTYDLIL